VNEDADTDMEDEIDQKKTQEEKEKKAKESKELKEKEEKEKKEKEEKEKEKEKKEKEEKEKEEKEKKEKEEKEKKDKEEKEKKEKEENEKKEKEQKELKEREEREQKEKEENEKKGNEDGSKKPREKRKQRLEKYLDKAIEISGEAKQHFNFEMTVTERNSKGEIKGMIMWPSLQKAKTKFRGKISGTKIEFEEYKVLSGKDFVDVPNQYSGVVKVVPSTHEEGVTEIRLVGTVRDSHKVDNPFDILLVQRRKA